MANTLANIIGFGGAASAVYVAPTGSTLPTTLADPAVAFVEVGWLSEDGVTYARDESKTIFHAHQGGAVVKRRTTAIDDTFKFQCLETTALVLGLLFKGVEPTVASSVATISVTNQTVADDRAWVIDEEGDDGSILRFVIPNGTVETTADVVFKNDEMTVYEFTVGVNGGLFTVITDAPAVIA